MIHASSRKTTTLQRTVLFSEQQNGHEGTRLWLDSTSQLEQTAGPKNKLTAAAPTPP